MPSCSADLFNNLTGEVDGHNDLLNDDTGEIVDHTDLLADVTREIVGLPISLLMVSVK